MAKTRTRAVTKASPSAQIQSRIILLRGERVMIDADLAELYGVTTKALNQAVKRNRDRFPPDFVFRLSRSEKNEVVTNCDHLARLRFSTTAPCAFTEHGALMAANVLSSARAVEMSVHVVRAFIRLRELVASHKALARKLTELERKLSTHDQAIAGLIDAIRELTHRPPAKRRPIGFVSARKYT